MLYQDDNVSLITSQNEKHKDNLLILNNFKIVTNYYIKHHKLPIFNWKTFTGKQIVIFGQCYVQRQVLQNLFSEVSPEIFIFSIFFNCITILLHFNICWNHDYVYQKTCYRHVSLLMLQTFRWASCHCGLTILFSRLLHVYEYRVEIHESFEMSDSRLLLRNWIRIHNTVEPCYQELSYNKTSL